MLVFWYLSLFQRPKIQKNNRKPRKMRLLLSVTASRIQTVLNRIYQLQNHVTAVL